MSTSRYLNWSRPSPGRHHPLRKQISCFESFAGGGRSLSVNNLASVSADQSVDFATFVTAATIHKNRFQNYHTYHQAHHRGTIISAADTGTSGGSGTSTPLVSDGGPPRATPRRRPASAHTTSSPSSPSPSPSSSVLSGLPMAKKVNAHESRKVLTKQLSLDHPGGGLGPAAGHAWTTTATRTPSVGGSGSIGADQPQSPKVCASSGIKKRPPGLSVKNDIESSEHIKKALKQGKDARINIKIFLGQTVQQDSSDTGLSDTECSPSQSQQHPRNQPQQPSSQPPPPQQQQQQQQQTQDQQGNQKAEAENSQPEGATKPKQQQSSGGGGSGRNSSLAQRRAQFQANRQNSETAERRPPLVRAMSAPIRPIDNDSKFLQSKKKTRKKKVLRERDEINECDEDDFDEETLKLNTTNSKNTLAAAATAAGGGGGPRSRSVLGGACDIETLVSLLSSGGSDSEKEDTVPTNGAEPTGNNTSTNFNINFSSALKSRAPMLKKAGKSVSFQETELKQTAGLNRDYYQPGHRKPPSLQPFANRIRRSQQLANTLNAFQKKKVTEDTKSDEDKDQHSSDESKDDATGSDSIPPSSNPTKAVQAASPSSSSSSSDAKTGEAGSGASGQDGGLVDGQTPKERECYRLFQKMSNMGLSVSYDTILRGMLTPTELRVLQKQRTKLQKQQESASRQNSSETEKETDSSDNSKSEGSAASASDLSSLLSSGPELEAVSERPLPVLAEQTVE